MRVVWTLILAVLLLAAIYGGVCWLYGDPMCNLHIPRTELRHDARRFGRAFLWGAATSAYQVEGNCPGSTWRQFGSRVGEDRQPRIPDGGDAGRAADHWNHFREDIQLLKSLGLNAYRFSVEWSRVEPLEGIFSDTALAHYRSVVNECRANGIEPMVTLHQYSDPAWFLNRGGFLQDDAPDLFCRFTGRVVTALMPSVRYWCTIYDPAGYAIHGYLTGDFPPGIHDPEKSVRVLRNLLRTHTDAYRIIRQGSVNAYAGLSINARIADPVSRWNVFDILGTHWYSESYNNAILSYLNEGDFLFHIPGLARERYLGRTKMSYDFVGVSYDTRERVRYNPFGDSPVTIQKGPAASELTSDGREIYPEGLYRALMIVKQNCRKPIFVTGIGVGDTSTAVRRDYIEDHLAAVNRAIRDGADIRGFFYRSLLDGFEWTEGWKAKYGLYAVDTASMARTLRPSSTTYPEIIQNGFTDR